MATNWRDTLDTDERRTIESAEQFAEFWQGITNNSPLILIAKLTRLLDEKGN